MSSNQYIIMISILFLFIIYLLYYIHSNKKSNQKVVKQTILVLNDVLKGNKNLRIHIDKNHLLSQLIFKVNELIEIYQLDFVKMKQSEQERKELFSSLSHDLRTPLTSILGYLEALIQEDDINKYDEYLNIVRSKAYALKTYLDELFTMAQIDASEIKINLHPIDLFEVIRKEIIGWIPTIEKGNKQLVVDIPDIEAIIMGDEHILNRIINNILQNALRYGGDTIGVCGNSNDEGFYIEIWDNGKGLSEEEINKVFQRLYKTDASRKSKGHGLGLAIVAELIKKIEGKVWMESIPLQKTKVCIVFPKSKIL